MANPYITQANSPGMVIPVGGYHIPGTPWDIPNPGDAIKGVEGAAAGISRTLTKVVIMIPVAAAGAALVVLGFWRMSSGPNKALTQDVIGGGQ